MGASTVWAHCCLPIDVKAHLESPAWCPSAGSTSLKECACCLAGRAWAAQPSFRAEALRGTVDSSRRRSVARSLEMWRFLDRILS